MDNNKSLLTLLLALAVLYALYQVFTNKDISVIKQENFRDIDEHDSDYRAVIPTFASQERAEEVSKQTKKELEGRSMCRCGPSCKCVGGMCQCNPNKNCGQRQGTGSNLGIKDSGGKGCAFYTNLDGCSPEGRCRSGSCDPGIDWNVKQEPGYCGKTNDTRWFQMEPRMILKDNSMRCGDNSCTARNGPPGIMDGSVDNHLGTLENLQRPNDMIYNKFQIPVIGTSDLSQNTGIIPIPQGCAMEKAMSNKCDCQKK